MKNLTRNKQTNKNLFKWPIETNNGSDIGYFLEITFSLSPITHNLKYFELLFVLNKIYYLHHVFYSEILEFLLDYSLLVSDSDGASISDYGLTKS